MPELHPDLAALAPLLGTWAGSGTGEYPTIEPFGYLEEITFGHIGKPFLAYTQRTRSAVGKPMHAETGYLRMPAAGRAELIIAQPTGVTEIDEGTVSTDDGIVIVLHSTSVGLSSTAKVVSAVNRSFRFFRDELTYAVEMSAVGKPMCHHLSATLHRMP